jgi:hypothetical protein
MTTPTKSLTCASFEPTVNGSSCGISLTHF